jgi:predicted PurR-regulated permease PerM
MARGVGYQRTDYVFARRVLIAVGVVTAFLLVLLLIWYIIDVFVLIFIGILIAIFLRGIGEWLASWSHLPQWSALALTILLLAGSVALLAWVLAPHITTQINRLSEELPQAVNRIEVFLRHLAGLGATQKSAALIGGIGGEISSKVGEFFTFTFSAVADAVVVFFISLYLAFSSDRYVRGIIKLVPISHRHTAANLIEDLGHTLQWWLIGTFSMMVIVAVLSGFGLWLLHIPLAMILGILAGLLTFVPFFGPILSLVPAVLIALLVSFAHVFWVMLLYLGIHVLEGYILEPLVQARTVYLPPIITLASLIAMSILLGVGGLIIATPLTTVVILFVKRIYIRGILGDRSI